jgi:hypothetical protein
MTRKNQHEWEFIASTENGELGFCRLCNKFRYDTGKPFKMSKAELWQLDPKSVAQTCDKAGQAI